MYRVGDAASLFGGLATLRILRQGTQIHRFRCAEENDTEHQKTAFRFDGVRIPIFTVPLLGAFGAFEGLQSRDWQGSWPSTAPRGADLGFDLAGHSQDGRRGGRGEC